MLDIITYHSVLTINSSYMLGIINDVRYNHIPQCSNYKLTINIGDNQDRVFSKQFGERQHHIRVTTLKGTSHPCDHIKGNITFV